MLEAAPSKGDRHVFPGHLHVGMLQVSDATNKILPVPAYSVGVALLHKSELPTPSLPLMSSAQTVLLLPHAGLAGKSAEKNPP